MRGHLWHGLSFFLLFLVAFRAIQIESEMKFDDMICKDMDALRTSVDQSLKMIKSLVVRCFHTCNLKKVFTIV